MCCAGTEGKRKLAAEVLGQVRGGCRRVGCPQPIFLTRHKSFREGEGHVRWEQRTLHLVTDALPAGIMAVTGTEREYPQACRCANQSLPASASTILWMTMSGSILSSLILRRAGCFSLNRVA